MNIQYTFYFMKDVHSDVEIDKHSECAENKYILELHSDVGI